MYIILVYDIALNQNGAKILRHVFKICKKYLSHVQKSVFEGELTKSQLKKLMIELGKWIRDGKDSVIIFKNRNKKWLDKQFLEMDMSDETSNFF
ncbi:CRISPR-associated endonuclease Cas2 [Ligilactobacillus agilis]|uniref:CRISPR-associated endonuclease Cas2 n=1 Tax=Ligilactobacillus agilis TaxID=1601 RepID=UPI00255C5868|nr:CRISPR-associated endonuclease Cas2 [Ligilactobacillus agilis]